MWNAYFDTCLNFSEDAKLGLGWYKHAAPQKRGYTGLTLHVFFFKWMATFTFVTNHEEYVKMITRNGRRSFDAKRLLPLPLPERKERDGTPKPRDRN